MPELGRAFYEHGAKLVRAFAVEILRSRFNKKTAAIRASTFVQIVLGDAHFELTLGYEVPDAEARFAAQIEEAVEVALR
jgi:TetR/AcrR family transcriptional regulator, mexJK operon transcriptional repressor